MGDMGIPGAYGAEGAAQALRQLLQDRIAAQQYADHMKQQEFENALRTRQQNFQEKLHGDTLTEQTHQHALVDEEKQNAVADKIANTVPAGTTTSPSDPMVGRLRAAGMGSLISDKGIAANPPESIASPDAPEGDMPGTIANSPFPAGRLVVKGASFNQQKDADERARKVAEAADKSDVQHQLADIRQTVADRGPKEPTPHFSVQQTYDETGKPNGLVRVNSITGDVAPVANAPNLKPPPGAAQAAQREASKKEALGSLDQLDKSIDDAASMLGPGSGRFSNLQQMIGSADPRIQALGTKMLMAKMQVDHAATGTVRAGASPQLLARWDNILANKVDPAGLKAAVQAMREILGGGAAPSAGGGVKVLSITQVK